MLKIEPKRFNLEKKTSEIHWKLQSRESFGEKFSWKSFRSKIEKSGQQNKVTHEKSKLFC